MELLNQPFSGQLGNRLIELLNSPDYHTLNIVVAFAKNSGVLRIKDALENFRGRGGIVNAYVGVDLGGTSYEALTALLLHTDSLNVIHSENDQTFHSKIYQFIGNKEGLIVVGSNNMTAGGLWTNFESSVLTPVENSSVEFGPILKEVGNYIESLSSLEDSLMQVGAQDDIDRLLEHGYVFKEVAQQIRLAKAVAQDRSRPRLFGNGAPAHLPYVETQKKAKVVTSVSEAPESFDSAFLKDEGHTIWFETKSMTGGSRNILDLSKKSLVELGDPKGTPFDLGDPKFMRGGVEFFGLDPAATDQKKSITLNFEGVDYSGNEILYPDGDNANGTWRLQIKGASSSERKITEAFRAKGEDFLLVKKVIAFTKINDDYYSLSVFPESELENFKVTSYILAWNGSTRTARQLGLIFQKIDNP